MLQQSFYRKIAVLIIAIYVLGAFFALSLGNTNWIGLSIIIILLALLCGFTVLSSFQKLVRALAFYVLGIKNEDSSVKYGQKSGIQLIDDIFSDLDGISETVYKAKKEVAIQEQYFKKIINQASTGLFSINQHHRIVNINPVAMELTDLYEQQHVNSLEGRIKALPKYLLHDPLQHNSAIFENEKGQKLLFKLSEIKVEEQRLRLVAVSDITRELDTGEVDAWVKLARTLSHEIMNNITPITTLVQLISDYYRIDGRPVKKEEISDKTIANTVKSLDIIHEKSSGLLRFVEDYRRFTKLPAPEYKKVDMKAFVQGILLMMKTFEGFENIALSQKFPQNCFFRTDDKLLHIVIFNIIRNAYESLTENNKEHAEILIELSFVRSKMILSIANNGPAIPEEIREQVFVPFFTTRDQGSGIGLSLSRQIMLKMNGDIVLKQKGDYTIFMINQKM